MSHPSKLRSRLRLVGMHARVAANHATALHATQTRRSTRTKRVPSTYNIYIFIAFYARARALPFSFYVKHRKVRQTSCVVASPLPPPIARGSELVQPANYPFVIACARASRRASLLCTRTREHKNTHVRFEKDTRCEQVMSVRAWVPDLNLFSWTIMSVCLCVVCKVYRVERLRRHARIAATTHTYAHTQAQPQLRKYI